MLTVFLVEALLADLPQFLQTDQQLFRLKHVTNSLACAVQREVSEKRAHPELPLGERT